MHAGGLFRPVAAEAREQHNKHAEEEQDHGRKDGPHARGIERVGAGGGVVGVDVVFDDLF